ncbi:MAG: SGNH/GDSL hydrolase family protein [Clostridia bacterium]|nr:SGNH/GDSL hydrolase family protein [Clostridia bacterium]
MSKLISILGDSISTFRGVSNDPIANLTTGRNPWYYREAFPLEGTYWSLFMKEFDLELCVNNSWSGGNLSGRDDDSSGVNRAYQLANDDGKSPDIILLFMGINDLGRGIATDVFESDYRETLAIIAREYKGAEVLCVNLPDRDIMLRERCNAFNAIIRQAVLDMGEGFYLADLASSRMRGDFYYMNTIDGLHPDEDGMRYIAEVVIDAWRERDSIKK